MEKEFSALVFDIETKKSFDEVGGRNNHHLLGISVIGVYDYLEDKYTAFEEKDVSKFEDLIEKRDLLIGFNTKDFDYKVLQPYLKKITLTNVNSLDLMESIERAAGFRVALNNLAKNTLGEEKSGHGLEALEWLREGRIEDVKKYCLDDVRLTKDLYEYGKKHGSVIFNSRVEGVKTIPALWANIGKKTETVKEILDEALDKKLMVEIDYISSSAKEGEKTRKKREIEIHSIRGGTVEAFCHLRKDTRNFKIWRIVDATIKAEAHTRPTLF